MIGSYAAHLSNNVDDLKKEIERLTALCEFHIAEAKKVDDLLLKENRRLRALLRAVMDNAKEEPWGRYAQVPRGYIRDIEKALANKQETVLDTQKETT